jgi:hypothetical protein
VYFSLNDNEPADLAIAEQVWYYLSEK